MPSFQLRSTAVYSPPDDDRFLSGRQELITTNVSNGKHYTPDDRLQKTVINCFSWRLDLLILG